MSAKWTAISAILMGEPAVYRCTFDKVSLTVNLGKPGLIRRAFSLVGVRLPGSAIVNCVFKGRR